MKIFKFMKIFRICIFFLILYNDVFSQSYVPEFNNEKVKIKPIVDIQVFAFSIKDVRLLDSPFKKAMERDANYLLSLDADRFLHRHRVNAGLEPKAEIYGGWEELGVSGFTLGHYISALSMYFAATGEEKFQSRVNYIVDELALMQELRKNGYVGGIPEEDRIWSEIGSGNIRAEAFDLNGGWVPFYTVHKLMAGLVDAYLYAENDIALDVVVKMSDWLYDLTKALSEEQMEEIMICEFGGLNDVLATIYAITGNKKYIDLSYRFNHKLITEPLSRREDHLNGVHANTQIPKLIGNAVQYGLTGDLSSYTAASFFWETVTDNHTYVIGGNSDYEMFGEPGKLSNRISSNTTETCNTYNMMKLTRHLFAYHPTSQYTDYYERGLYNHILASQNPEDGMMCYYVPLKMGGYKKYNTPFHSFWCCTGTGMENHVKYGENIYARGKDGSLFVNLFISSELDWKEKNVKIIQETSYPDSDQIRLSIKTTENQFFPIRIRKPEWAKQGVQIKVNGKVETVFDVVEGYIVINRNWENNDIIEIKIPLGLYTENMPDNKNRISILFGPLVLAGTFDKQSFELQEEPTVLIGDRQKILDNIVPVSDQSIGFKTIGIAQPSDVALMPFYQVHNQYYNVYWDLFSKEEWVKNRAKYKEENDRLAKLGEITVDHVRVGEQQPEIDHNFEGFKTKTGDFEGRKWRDAKNGGWFSYQMKVEPDNKNILLINFWDNNEHSRKFDLLINNVEIKSYKEIKNKSINSTGIYFQIPEELIQAKKSVSIKIHSNPYSGKVFDLRILKQDY
jgi:uncharacterized protein